MNLIKLLCDFTRKVNKKNNGSTLITVIVVISFVTILTTILLGTTATNYMMKNVDRATKDDFYYAEKALNDVYAGVGQVAAKEAGKAYNEAFRKVGTTDGTTDFNTAATARVEFKKQFLEKVYDYYKTDTLTELKKYKVPVSVTRIDSVEIEDAKNIKYKYSDGTKGDVYKTKTPPSTDTVETDALVIADVKVVSKDKAGYQSVLTTDIVIEVPTLDFFGVNADVTEYGIIACQGLYVNGQSTINGNVYAGVHDSAISSLDDNAKKLFGGINVTSGTVSMRGNYIVSKGDINVSGSGTRFTVENAAAGSANLPNLWFDTLRTVKGSSSPYVRVKANSFALNDLELNGDDSEVAFEGNYYGYNDVTSIGALDSLSFASSNTEDDESSSIIINGKRATLDMSNIETFVLMGKAYVDFTSKNGSASAGQEVVATAEGVALKTNQQIYIVPNDFMSCPNPADDVHYTEVRADGTSGFSIDIGDKVKDWFGYDFVKKASDNVEDIYKHYTVTDSSGNTIHYAYLDFNDHLWDISGTDPVDVTGQSGYVNVGDHGCVSSKTAFFYKIMNATYDATYEEASTTIHPSAYRLYDRIRDSIDNDKPYGFDLTSCIIGDVSHNNINDPDGAVIYARNAVVSYTQPTGTDTKIQTNLMVNKVGMERYFNYTQNLLHRYQILCTYLDGSEKISLDNDPLASANIGNHSVAIDATKITNNWNTNPSTMPLEQFILLAKVAGKDTTGVTDGLEEAAYGACIIKDGDISISANVGSTFKGIAIANGNITVPAGINVNGLLMATGIITIEGGGSTITADKGLLQSRVEKEINLVETSTELNIEDAYKDHYLIKYLTSDGVNRMYNIDAASKKPEEKISADYNDFMHYENWQKGAR